MHHAHATTPHATIACIANKTYSTTQLTACHEGTITQEESTWRGDMTQERMEGQQVHKMGQAYAPRPCHNPSRNHRMHCQQNLQHNPTHGLSRRNHNTGGKHVAGRHYPREKGWSASAQDGADLFTTTIATTLTQPTHAPPTKPLALSYSLAARKEARHGREACCGRSNPREIGRSASAQDGAGQCTTPMPQPLTQPSHALPTKPIAQPNSQAATKEASHGRETRGWET